MEWYIFVIISAILISASELMKKKVLFKEHSAEFSTTYSLIITILLLPFIGYLDLDLPNSVIVLLIIKSIILLVSSLLFMKAMKHNELSQVMPLKNLSPVFLLIIAFLILNEQINTTKILGIFIIMASGYLLEKESLKHDKVFRTKYFFYVLISMILVSFGAIIDKFLIRYANIYTILFVPFALMSVYLLLIQFGIYRGFQDIKHSIKKGGYWILLSAVAILLSDLSYFGAVALEGALISLIIPLRRISTFFTTLFGGALFHEKSVLDRVSLCIFMLMGVYLILIA